MFTGLVQAVGTVCEVCQIPDGVRLTIDPAGWSPRATQGGSVSVNGCCLTLTADPADAGGKLGFIAIPETLGKTILGGLTPGSRVNLETAVSAQTLMGGHFVQGHVDGVGSVTQISKPDQTHGECRVRLSPPAALMKFMSPKGSVCLDGVSLTIAEIGPGNRQGQGGWIEIALIPETLEKTTLGSWKIGDRVNIEADMLAKTVIQFLENYAGPVVPTKETES